ncbi:type VI secretion system-associated protein TagO [Shewanella sp. VB17]|uniref:type VI secretion system-associated protein VasI n=1 Tax=Shewanella sp. VB17 TaxID=2739432 RepID=UPI0015654A47|nr:type VI secretion system-associated protein VasI [Shewanella sp. VB17]NRD73747.1 type VI secretion system-associated protein TagO [Shewanella sp. VB17]
MLQGKGLILSGLLLSASMCYAQAQTLDDAHSCVTITSKLERLYCFDRVFSTPLFTPSKVEVQGHAVEQTRALANEARRTSETHFLLGQEKNNPDNVWLTASAIGALPPRPILMLSCIDGISRVELILADYVDKGSVLVAINKSLTAGQRWISDDTGFVFRSGRGVPSIKRMKEMLAGESFTLHSDQAQFNDLQFDAQGLKQALKPLRNICGW